MQYETKGTCSSAIDFDVIDNKIHNVRFTGGCSGNLQGICKLVEGMDVDKVEALLSGIHCGGKDTSCPDQLAKAIKQIKNRV